MGTEQGQHSRNSKLIFVIIKFGFGHSKRSSRLTVGFAMVVRRSRHKYEMYYNEFIISHAPSWKQKVIFNLPAWTKGVRNWKFQPFGRLGGTIGRWVCYWSPLPQLAQRGWLLPSRYGPIFRVPCIHESGEVGPRDGDLAKNNSNVLYQVGFGKLTVNVDLKKGLMENSPRGFRWGCWGIWL